jgi:hypothetical protein
MSGEKDATTHDVQVKERRDQGEHADGKEGFGGCDGSHSAMREPVKELGETGNTDGDDKIAELPRTEGKSTLLHSGVQARSEGDVGYLDCHNGKPAVRARPDHRQQINQRTNSSAHQPTLPIPAGTGLHKDERPPFALHGNIVSEHPQMNRHTRVKAALRSVTQVIKLIPRPL